MNNLAIYIHWPFCLSKCPYCDFNSRVMPEKEDQKNWAKNYAQELSFYAQDLPSRNITSIYFGGGTPSLMEPETVAAVLNKIAALWRVDDTCEITIEANPTSCETSKFQNFHAAGVSRLSLGVQSLDDTVLMFLGRTHDAVSARRAIDMAAKIFDRFSFDLIYARAAQTMKAWEEELASALSFSPQHLSLYQLTLEEGSVFYKRPDRESLILPEGLAADMFLATQDIMESVGLPAYEISNYAKAGQESHHNMAYWRYDDYIGIGPGAHGRFVDVAGQRWATENHKAPSLWQQDCQKREHGTFHKEEVTILVAQQEAFLMGLRLSEGVNKNNWQEKFESSLDDFLCPEKRHVLEKEGLIIQTSKTLNVTKEGRIKMNGIMSFLL